MNVKFSNYYLQSFYIVSVSKAINFNQQKKYIQMGEANKYGNQCERNVEV